MSAIKQTDKAIETDILVIGGGIAGSLAAIKAKEAGIEKVTLVSKGQLGKDSISSFAAGVWIAFMPEDDKDALFKNFALSDVHGAGLYDEEWLEVFLNENYERLVELDKWGVEWEKTPDGKVRRRETPYHMHRFRYPGAEYVRRSRRKIRQCRRGKIHAGV